MREMTNELGSSPLTRGKPSVTLWRRVRSRLIPAHAGKTVAIYELEARVGAHPRSRGENDYFPTGATLREGSSPLTRGKRPIPWLRRRQGGLIPAHAGKTTSGPPRKGETPAHPRSRGENLLSEERAADEGGSSPLTRGKPCLLDCFEHEWGLIPAHAGKTLLKPTDTVHIRAHPRSRGENRVG